MDIVGRIRELCERRGISINKLENVIGVGNSTIRRWDTSSPSVDKILNVAHYFDVSVDYLLDNELKEDETMQEIRWLIAGSRVLTEDERNRIFKMLKAYLE